MIHAYNEIYLNNVMHNLGALFDIAVNAMGFDPDKFANQFAESKIATGIENGLPDFLAGKSATEMLMILLNEDVSYDMIPIDRTPEYWAGWILGNAQWYLNKSFKEILSVISFSDLIKMYHPYHEASEMKVIDIIQKKFPFESSLKIIRQKRKLTQEQLAFLSGVNIRSIRSYEQGDNDINKAQGDTLLMLARALDCTVEELLS